MSQQDGAGSLTPVSEDWQRALAIMAHPDDLEYGGAAAIARWTGQGKWVGYALVTSGEAGIKSVEPALAGPLREREQRAAAAIVGVDSVEFLGQPDGMLEYGLPLRRELAATVRRHRPEIVLTNNLRETWNGVTLNQADHIVTARAVLDAVRDAGNRWVFRDLLDRGLEPWSGVRQVWAVNPPVATHGVDVTESFEAGVRSLAAHTEYLRGLGGRSFDPEAFHAGLFGAVGARLGCRYGVAFEVFHL